MYLINNKYLTFKKFNVSKYLIKVPFIVVSLLSFSVSWVATAEELPPVDCVINPYKTVDITSAVPGVLDEVRVKRSDWIAKDNIIAVLESSVEKATVALANVRAEIDSEIRLSEVSLAFAIKQQARVDKLYARQTVSDKVKDEADRDVELSIWQLQQAKDLKKVRQLELQRAREEIRQKTIRAPFEGFVLQIFKDEGEHVEDQPIVRLAQFDPLLIEAIVPMEQFGKIEIGMAGLVYPELYTDDPKEARVVAVDRMGDAASRTFGVRLELPNPDFTIPAGLKCEMKFL